MRRLTIDDMHIGETIHHGIYGDFTIISYVGYQYGKHYVRVKFHTTGYEKDVTINSALSNCVRDPYFPQTYGIAYAGEYEEAPDTARIHSLWKGIHSKCYNPSDPNYSKYGAIGVSIDPRWHCFADFLKDFRNLINYDKWLMYKGRFHLDIELLQKSVPPGQRVYSPETCILIDNTYPHFGDEYIKEPSRFLNVHKSDGNNFYTTISTGNSTFRATFDSDYHASVYREFILSNRNIGEPVPVPVPTTVEAFKKAQQHRRCLGNNKYPYKRLYNIINENEENNV